MDVHYFVCVVLFPHVSSLRLGGLPSFYGSHQPNDFHFVCSSMAGARLTLSTTWVIVSVISDMRYLGSY